MAYKFRVDFTAHMTDGKKEMYMIVTAETVEEARSIVENAVTCRIVIHGDGG
ncbi:MAG: hypothetical protein V3U49_03705 [Nitrososphaerales archaeon]